MTIKRKTLAVLLGGLVAVVVGWFAWRSNHSHGQGSIESHQHLHVHGEGIDHGHQHPEETTVALTHSHPHQHDRHRHDSEKLPDREGLTEIGHSHDSPDSMTYYWAQLTAEDSRRFVLNFFTSQEGKIKTSSPKASCLTALIFNGSKLERRAKFEKSDSGKYIAELPDFLVLPEHFFKIENLEFGDMQFDALLSVDQ